ncbi:MAG: hypothetical protein ABFE13_11405 [Phycisphaerales bacterium]
MNWLNNGSKTLVACVACAVIGWICHDGKITGDQALGVISFIATAYFGVNVYQNRGQTPPSQPPAA